MARFYQHLTSFWHLWALLILVAGGTGCSGFAAFSEKTFMMTPEQEVQFGEQVARKIESEVKLVQDPAVVSYVRAVGDKVWKNSPVSLIPARFFVVQDDAVNAFAIPGGSIYINTGLINAVDDESELAAVMAHEAGHVIRRHGARQASHTAGVDRIQAVVIGKNSPQAAQIVGTLLGKGILVAYSKDDERQADEIAVLTLARAGYDPMALYHLFSKVTDKSSGHGPLTNLTNLVTDKLASHPPTQERIANVEAMAHSLSPKKYKNSITELRRAQYRLKQLGLAK